MRYSVVVISDSEQKVYLDFFNNIKDRNEFYNKKKQSGSEVYKAKENIKNGHISFTLEHKCNSCAEHCPARRINLYDQMVRANDE